MIRQQEFDALVAVYDKHGWLLRRVVLSDIGKAPGGLGKGVQITKGVIEAAWFSRPPQPGLVAWEIRYLGPTQYSLVEHIDERSGDFEEKLHQTEQRLAEAISAKRTA